MTPILPIIVGSAPGSRLPACLRARRLACRVLVWILPLMLALPALAGTITLSDLTHTYNGSQKSATVTTDPDGLDYTITYEGLIDEPTDAGSYAVEATIVDEVETGSVNGTLVIAKASQTITFPTISNKTFGNAQFAPGATTTSSLPIAYASSNTAVATVSGSTVTIVGAGSTNITASQAGDANWLAATNVVRTLTVAKASQTITFPAISAKVRTDLSFNPGATASSGLTVSYSSSEASVATVSGSTITIRGFGTTTITASQGGNANYNVAPTIARTLNVGLQSINLGTMPTGKKYGDGPFPVSATASTGLPLTFQSSDPTVATVSGNTVSIVGAGQCSILAVQAGNSEYAYTVVGQPLNVASSDLPLPPASLTKTYDGTPKGIDPAVLPTGAAVQIRYRNQNQLEPAPAPQLAFQNGPDTLALSYFSLGFSAQSLSGLGKYVEMAGSARKLHSCDVTLVTWAQYNNVADYGFLTWANANPTLVLPPSAGVSIPGDSGGWYHPITLSFYDYDSGAKTWTCLTSKTVQAFIPWRPMKLANGSNYPYSGYAFRVPFSFPDGVILPDNVWIKVGFNTKSYGTAPIGVTGPYDALNVAQPVSSVAGRDLFQAYQLLYRNWTWSSPSDLAGPMLRLWTTPTNATLTPPTEPGTYEVKTVSTGIGVTGEATTALTIGYDFPGWIGRQVSLGGLPPGQISDSDDPDGDGLTNLQEYAFNLNPGTPDFAPGHPPRLSSAEPNLAFTYRRNLHAFDVTYAIEGSQNLASPAAWNPVVPLLESPVSDDGATRVIRATVPKPDAPGYFLRLKVSR